MTERAPCPDCGSNQTIELLRWKIERLEIIKRNRAKEKLQQQWIDSSIETSMVNTLYTTTANPLLTADKLGFYGSTGTTINPYNIHIHTTWPTSAPLLEPVPDEIPEYQNLPSTIHSYGMECCIGCSRYYNPYFKSDAETLAAALEAFESELFHPLERLGLASE